MQPITVYRIDPKTRLFMYPEPVLPDPDGEYVVPGNCVLVAPPPAGENERAQWGDELPLLDPNFGRPGTSTWQVIGDHRKAGLYLTSDGSKYEIDQEIDGQTYDGIGPLPSWLTLAERPSPYHHWTSGAWVLNEQEELDALIAEKVVELSRECQAQIYAGFTSSALGEEHHYPALATDQQNLTASVLDSTVPGLPEGWQTPFWCSLGGEWDFRMHSAEQIQRVGRDAKLVILACMAHNAALASAARSAQNKAALESIVWTAPQIA